ncbi:MAG: YiiD C-terminal domain-containing protein [Methanomassiliicoccales archaeon]|jgi:acyl-CoA thioesterase|nr:YiiD C-terminal domain-containing protein [Methanomassiliicoccales archaeon]
MKEKLVIHQDPEERFHAIDNSEFSTFMGMRTVRVSEEEVQVEMDLEGKLNSVGTGHGGAIFSLADQAFAIACNIGEHTQVARSASIKYIKPARGTLVATARKAKEDDLGSIYKVEVTAGKVVVAIFEGVGHKIK